MIIKELIVKLNAGIPKGLFILDMERVAGVNSKLKEDAGGVDPAVIDKAMEELRKEAVERGE